MFQSETKHQIQRDSIYFFLGYQPSSTTANTCDTRFIIHRGIRLSHEYTYSPLMKDTGVVARQQPREKEGSRSSIRKISTRPVFVTFLSLSPFLYASASIHFVSVTRKVAARNRLFFENETTCVHVCDSYARFVRTWIREGRYVGSNKRGEQWRIHNATLPSLPLYYAFPSVRALARLRSLRTFPCLSNAGSTLSRTSPTIASCIHHQPFLAYCIRLHLHAHSSQQPD